MTIRTGVIWHFSDFHLDPDQPPNSPDIKSDVESLSNQFFSAPLLPALFRFIAQERRADGNRVPDALVISGDLVHRGNWANPTLVRELIDRLREVLGLSPERVIVIPGNHDLTWRNPLIPRARMHEAFAEATHGYITPMGKTARYYRVPGTPISLLLADSVSLAGAAVGTGQIIRILRESTPRALRFLLRGVSQKIEAALREDIAAIPLEDLQKALDGEFGPADLPAAELGLLISHHPLIPHPLDNVEVKAFGVALAAGQTKTMLARRGIHVCLHGHHHSQVIVAEEMTAVDGPFAFCNIAAASLNQEPSKGFNIIHYALADETGEATLLVTPARLEGSGVEKSVSRRVYVPPRVGAVARSIRITERINPHGDTRTDVWYSDVPTRAWKRHTGAPTLEIPLLVESPGGHLEEFPAVESLTRGSSAEFRVSTESPAFLLPPDPARASLVGDVEHVRGTIAVTAKDALECVSFAYRVFANHSYSVSIADRVRSSSFSKDAFPGWLPRDEALISTIRISAERLDVFVRTPSAAPRSEDVRVHCYGSGANLELTHLPDLEHVTKHVVDSWPEAKRIWLSIERPLQGAAYAVVWPLPADLPSNGMNGGSLDSMNAATRSLEAVRDRILKHRSSSSWAPAGTAERIASTLGEVRNIVTRATKYDWSDAELEQAVFIRESEILETDEYFRRATTNQEIGHPYLGILGGNFDRADPRWNVRLLAGLGVAGRAYATNFVVGYNAENWKSGSSGRVLLSPYLRLKEDQSLDPHAVLYAFPLRHWAEKNAVLGCLCVGTRGLGTAPLDLEGTDPVTGRQWVQLILAAGQNLTLDLARLTGVVS